MSFDFKGFAQKFIDAAAEKNIPIVLDDVDKLLVGLYQIGKEAATKGETKLATKAGISDPMAENAE